jgi:hypothetical protein
LAIIIGMRARKLVSVFCAGFLLASCSDRGQEMEEKIAQMQKQLDAAQKQLQAANQALASQQPTPQQITQTSTSSTTGGLPPRETVEQTYATSVSSFRKELEAKLKNFRVESCTTHSVEMPTEFFPFTSQISLALVSDDGQNFSTDIPVKADVTGKWIFPSVAEVTQRIGSVQRVASSSGSSRSKSPQEPTAAASQPPPYMKVDGTFVVQWPDSHPQAPPAAMRTPAIAESQPVATAAPTAAAPPSPRPQPTAVQSSNQPGAQPVMPVDRDVHIQFGTPPPN